MGQSAPTSVEVMSIGAGAKTRDRGVPRDSTLAKRGPGATQAGCGSEPGE
jgi:hypothetical protein